MTHDNKAAIHPSICGERLAERIRICIGIIIIGAMITKSLKHLWRWPIRAFITIELDQCMNRDTGACAECFQRLTRNVLGHLVQFWARTDKIGGICIHHLSYFSESASTNICAGRRMSELRVPVLVLVPLTRELPLVSANRLSGCDTGCLLIMGVSAGCSMACCTISMPLRKVIMSRIKHATAEAADPLSFAVSKRLEVASPAA